MNSIKIFEQLVRLRGYTILDSKTYLVFNPVNQTRIQFFLCNQEKLDMSYFYKAYEQLPENISHLVFIYNFATIQIKKLKMYKDILKIEFFHENELRRLLIGNRLIPKHAQVDTQTREQVIQTFGRDNLPMILHTDPMVRLHDFELDSVVQIDRPDAVYYRLVVSDD
jgi:DNA-directed RNA polymerase subunit H (RpoH/RPB5)